jgi:glycosyltransferase involved in cell wall biosynthesis
LLLACDPLRKGLATALEALSKLPDHYKLAVVGADAASRQYFSDRYPELIERVTLLEPVSDVSQFYQAADICIHPTLLDSFGMVPLEAMAHGLPVILSSSKYCGFADYVRHHHDAWVIENPKDAAELAAALFSLGENQSLRDQLVSHSTSIVQRFSWQTVAEQYLEIYAEVVRLKRSSHSQPRTQ